MTKNANNNSIVFWQSGNDDAPVPEPALLISGYDDVISIKSEGGYINLNYDSLEEFIKALRTVKKNKD